MTRSISIFFIFISTVAGQTSYDLLLKGGHVIDPKNRINAVMDVAVSNGRIAPGGHSEIRTAGLANE